MPTVINGLPAHALLIHVVIAAVPLAAVLVVLHAVWPAARRRLGIVTPVVAAVALVFVPITTSAGEWLERHLQASGEVEARIRHHAQLGHTLLPLVAGLFVVAAALWLLGRRYEYGVMRARATAAAAVPTWATALIAVVAVAVAVINVVQLYRIGDAGAQAVWNGVVPSH